MTHPLGTDFADVFMDQRPRLLAHAQALLHNQQQAEDVVQESFLRIRRAAARETIANPAAFLFRVTHNLALDLLRQRRRGHQAQIDDLGGAEPASDAPGVEETLIARERLEAVAAALSDLPPRSVEVLILSRLRGWPHHRIAKELGVAERTVFNDLRMALLHCRAKLGEADA